LNIHKQKYIAYEQIINEKNGPKAVAADMHTQEFDTVKEERNLKEDAIDLYESIEHDYTTRLYVCVTMYHEKKSEIRATITSLAKLDFDQACRRIALQKDSEKQEEEATKNLEPQHQQSTSSS